MRILDFRFNGLVVEPVIETDRRGEGFVDLMQNIKQIGEAKRLALSLDIAIKAMEKKEQEDTQVRILKIHEDLIAQDLAYRDGQAKLEKLQEEYFANYGVAWSEGLGALGYSPKAAEQT